MPARMESLLSKTNLVDPGVLSSYELFAILSESPWIDGETHMSMAETSDAPNQESEAQTGPPGPPCVSLW
jgi:hypothetical protein